MAAMGIIVPHMSPLTLAVQTTIPTEQGVFSLAAFEGFADGKEHLALIYGDIVGREDVLTRIHSECLTGEVFGSQRCDCQTQLQDAMKQVVEAGSGVILYLRQEGRGIGIKNKLRAYKLQDEGMDTVEANEALGFAGDLRDFAPAVQMLQALNIKSVKLMTNSRDKIQALVDAGIMVTRLPSLSCIRTTSADYLQTKAEKMGHLIPLEIFSQLKKTRA